MQELNPNIVYVEPLMLRRQAKGALLKTPARSDWSGDWDLGLRPIDLQSLVPTPAFTCLSSLAASDSAKVAIGREGDFILLGKPRPLAVHLRDGKEFISSRIVGRHPAWIAFRAELLAFADSEQGMVYAPIPHPDLCSVPSWNDHSRWQAISQKLSPASFTALDIGANFGYMSWQLQRAGKQCTAVEVDERYFYFLTKIKRACSAQFTAFQEDIFEFVEKSCRFDTVLALAVFHHFIKKEDHHQRMLIMLRKLKMKEMFFWAHNPKEGQMQKAYRNYNPGEFLELIKLNSCLNRSQPIAEIEYRPLYHLWHE